MNENLQLNRKTLSDFIQEKIALDKKSYKQEIKKFFNKRNALLCKKIVAPLGLKNDDEFPAILYFYSLKLGERIIVEFNPKNWMSSKEDELTSNIFSNPFGGTFHVLGEAVWKDYKKIPILVCGKNMQDLKNRDGVVTIEVKKDFEDFLKDDRRNKEKGNLIKAFNNNFEDFIENIDPKLREQYRKIMSSNRDELVSAIQSDNLVKEIDEVTKQFNSLIKSSPLNYKEDDIYKLIANPVRHWLSPFQINNIVYIKAPVPTEVVGGVVFSHPKVMEWLKEKVNCQDKLEKLQDNLCNNIFSPIIITESSFSTTEPFTYQSKYFYGK